MTDFEISQSYQRLIREEHNSACNSPREDIFQFWISRRDEKIRDYVDFLISTRQ